MTRVHVRRDETALGEIQINPAHVTNVMSPLADASSGANAIITLTCGTELYVIEPRAVVFALIGNAAMDKKSNPGYFHAVKGVGDDEWLVRRADYPTE